MLESRLANCALLKEISNPKVIRLVHFQRRYWLEYSVDATAEAEDDIGASPSLRFPFPVTAPLIWRRHANQVETSVISIRN
jgi:hypothetical protein